jgi:hypothetical protein
MHRYSVVLTDISLYLRSFSPNEKKRNVFALARLYWYYRTIPFILLDLHGKYESVSLEKGDKSDESRSIPFAGD